MFSSTMVCTVATVFFSLIAFQSLMICHLMSCLQVVFDHDGELSHQIILISVEYTLIFIMFAKVLLMITICSIH
jgi:hypothetical protein